MTHVDINMSKYVPGILQSIIILLLVYFGNSVIENGKALVNLTTLSAITTTHFADHEDRIRTLESTGSGRENQ